MSKEQRSYTPEFKIQSVKLAREIGNKKAAVELNVPVETIGSWVSEAKSGRIDTGAGTQTPQSEMTQAARIKQLEDENRIHLKEIKRLNELNEFLEEASAFFASRRRK